MLNYICLVTNDLYWNKILSDLFATVCSDGIIFETPKTKLTPQKLLDYVHTLQAKHLRRIGADSLSEAEQKLILMLPRASAELKQQMGYVNVNKTHTVETIIYNIRKKMGQDFIKLENGKYKL